MGTVNAQQSIRKRKRPELPDRVAPWCARIKRGAIWAGQGDVCVWPPIVIGGEDVDSNVLRQARCVIKDEGFGEEEFATIHIGRGSVQKLLVFEPTAKCYLAARVLGEVCNQGIYKHATVNDMTAIDPHKELVQWIPPTNNIERDLNPNAARAKEVQEKIVQEIEEQVQHLRSQTLSPSHQEELVDKLSELVNLDSKLPTQECGGRLCTYSQIRDKVVDYEEKVSTFLMQSCEREAIMKALIKVNYVRVTKSALGKAKELGGLWRAANGDKENGDQFLSKALMEKAMEMERQTLNLLVKDIEQKRILEVELDQESKSDVDLTLQFLARQYEELMMHLRSLMAAKERRFEERLSSKFELLKHIRCTQQKTSTIKRFFSSDVAKVVEEVYSGALTELHNKVTTLAATVNKMKEEKTNIVECIICFGDLEESSSPWSEPLTPEATFHSKKLKRACFLPCMHASVCTTCSHTLWETGPQVCPVCKEKLSEKPKPIFL